MRPLAPSAPPPGFMSSCWTNDEIILSLDQINRGSPIPDDVIVDNPYKYDPSDLPDGAWFLVRLTEKEVRENGFWIARGEACEIFANSAICGWRTTFEYFKFQAPWEQKTVWMMQEYKITPKGQHDPTQSQESALCRVFSCCDENLNNEMKPEDKNKINNEKSSEKNNDLDTWDLSLMESFGSHTSNHGERSIGEPQVSSQTEGVGSSLVDKSRDSFGDDIVAELDCILRGDFLEMNDLVDAASHSSSSENSSCVSMASDEYFDSLALLRELDDEKKEDLNGKGSTSNYNMMTCEIIFEVVQPAPLVSLVKGSDAAAKETQQAPDNNKSKSPIEPSPDHAAKRLKAERTDEGPSHSCRATTSPGASSSSSSSSSHEPGRAARREEKRTMKLMKYLCFMPF
ncbi:hypothetical protein HAX54_020994 [Datura stramonium]|uniref:NAC domain-containing protein n=1 Tax=Datura stramonium TaxID=4076 RepID=A0ABS8S2Y1_DATST|nr:hypothetical protein [Datura stramonium]